MAHIQNQNEKEKVQITLIIDKDKWDFLSPILGQYVADNPQPIKPEDSYIDFDKILELPQGRRIIYILNDGCWGPTYTLVDKDYDGDNIYSVRKVSELKRIAMPEYMKHRYASKTNWAILKEYINTL